jgi:hypothetical protein
MKIKINILLLLILTLIVGGQTASALVTCSPTPPGTIATPAGGIGVNNGVLQLCSPTGTWAGVGGSVGQTMPATCVAGGELSFNQATGAPVYCPTGTPKNWTPASPWIITGANLGYSAGNVGIGTTAPSAKLEIQGSANSILKISDGNQGSGKVLTSDATGQASWLMPNIFTITGGLCSSGQAVTSITATGAVTCSTLPSAGTVPTTAPTTAPTTSPSTFSITGGNCPQGQVVTSITATGAVTCGVAPSSLTITGGGCTTGQVVTSITSAGVVTCGAAPSAITVVNGSNPSCPNGTVELFRYWNAQTFSGGNTTGTNWTCFVIGTLSPGAPFCSKIHPSTATTWSKIYCQ